MVSESAEVHCEVLCVLAVLCVCDGVLCYMKGMCFQVTLLISSYHCSISKFISSKVPCCTVWVSVMLREISSLNSC